MTDERLSMGGVAVRFADLRGTEEPTVEAGELALWQAPMPGDARRHLAIDVLEKGLNAFPAGESTISRLVVSEDPTLDDLLAADFVARLMGGQSVGPGAEDLARYAALLREGLEAGTVPLAASLEGIFHAIRAEVGALSKREAAAGELLDRWQELSRALWEELEKGRSPFRDELFSERPEFARERAFLQQDERVYRQDVLRGQRWLVRLPGGPELGSGLILQQPRSVLFKHWARCDEEAPAGGTYLLLGVSTEDGIWIFSTDPIQRLSLAELAHQLQQAELAVNPSADADPWFDGAPFAHSLIAAPRSGTRLPAGRVLKIVRSWAAAKDPPRTGARRRRTSLMLAIIGACCLALLVAAIVLSLKEWRTLSRLRTGSSGVARQVINFDQRTDELGPGNREIIRKAGMLKTFAILVCVSKSSMGELKYPCVDAVAFYRLLKERYGVQQKDVVFLGDDKEALQRVPHDQPTAVNFRRRLQILSGKTHAYGRDGDKTGRGFNVIVYLAGHGTKRPEGYFVLSGCYEKALSQTQGGSHEDRSTRGNCLEMEGLAGRIKKDTGARHVLLLLDSCYSGYAIQARYRGKKVRSFGKVWKEWNQDSLEVITAANSDQRAWENQKLKHSAFSALLLQGLSQQKKGASGGVPADSEPLDGDGLVTGSELFLYIQQRIDSVLKDVTTEKQTPRYSRGLAGDGLGQFIFIPARRK